MVLITEVTSHYSCGHILLIRSESASGSSHTQGEITQGCEHQEAVMTGSILEAAYHFPLWLSRGDYFSLVLQRSGSFKS